MAVGGSSDTGKRGGRDEFTPEVEGRGMGDCSNPAKYKEPAYPCTPAPSSHLPSSSAPQPSFHPSSSFLSEVTIPHLPLLTPPPDSFATFHHQRHHHHHHHHVCDTRAHAHT